ncbi:MAG: serine/threonine protein kinase [Myxococcota bacterium]|nr:serine/threonine protein kinase [Myxococcota bacterium]
MTPPSDRAGSASHAESGGGMDRKSERPSARSHPPQSLVGRVLSGRYRIQRLIGEGGMGAVYQAEHTQIRKRVAVKVLHAEMIRLPEVVARFEREALAAAHIDHPNVAAASDFGKLEDGSFFLVLEYVEGKSLRDALAGGRLELGRALHIARQIASALSRAHALGIVHRDLKPENVMLVTKDGHENFVKVLDFGIAKVPVGEIVGESKAPGQALTQMGMVYGTPEYMAPEQALGQPVDARADFYALGALTFEMITGGRPYDHESKVTLLGMHVMAPIPRMAERAPDACVPDVVDAIVTRLLAKEASARFPDAKELLEALDEAMVQLIALGEIARSGETPPPMLLGRSAQLSSPRIASPDGSSPSASGEPSTGAGDLASIRRSSATHSRGTSGSDAPVFGAVVGALARERAGGRRGMNLRRIALAASLAGVFVVLGVVIGLGNGRGVGAPGGAPAAVPSATVTSIVTQPPPPQRPAERTNDAIVSNAQSKIDKGDFATAIEELTAVEAKEPARTAVHMLLEPAYTGTRNTREAMEEADRWLRTAPEAASDLKLDEDIRNAALLKDSQDDAFALLESKMGSRGIDILYDIGYGASGRQYPQAALRAKHMLDVPAVRARASRALSVLLELREAKTCEQKHALLERARDHGDSRLLSILQPYELTRGCGFLGRTDCHPCMRKDHLLTEATSAIEDRIAKTQ